MDCPLRIHTHKKEQTNQLKSICHPANVIGHWVPSALLCSATLVSRLYELFGYPPKYDGFSLLALDYRRCRNVRPCGRSSFAILSDIFLGESYLSISMASSLPSGVGCQTAIDWGNAFGWHNNSWLTDFLFIRGTKVAQTFVDHERQLITRNQRLESQHSPFLDDVDQRTCSVAGWSVTGTVFT